MAIDEGYDKDLVKLVKLAIETGALPRYVYKFRPLNSFFDDIINNNQLWFSKSIDFNDPFDSQITIDTKNSYSDIVQFYKRDPKNKKSNKEISKLAKRLVRNPQDHARMINEVIKPMINKNGICCFAGNYTNILLWSHYSNSHKGACLKFDILANPEFFNTPFKVIYQKNYPRYNFIKNPPIRGDAINVGKMINSLLLTKSDAWYYEDEIRVIKPKDGLFKFKCESLVEIIFGCKSSKKEITRIKNLVEKRNYKHLAFKKAGLLKNKYGLKFTVI